MNIIKDQNDKMSRDIDKCLQSPNIIMELKDLIKEYNKEIIQLKQQLKRYKNVTRTQWNKRS